MLSLLQCFIEMLDQQTVFSDGIGNGDLKSKMFNNNITSPFRGLFVATAAVSTVALFLSYQLLVYKRALESRIGELELRVQNLQPEVSNLNAMYSEMVDKELDKVKRDYARAIASMTNFKETMQKKFKLI